jgi:hypothetical protein
MPKVKGFIDADGHVVEADAELLDFLPAPFKGRADLLSFPFFPTLDGFHRQARRVVDGKGRYIAKGNLQEWREFLDEDEIAWSVLYPTTGLTFGLVRDKEWACALATGYNNYLYETFTKPEKTLERHGAYPAAEYPRSDQGAQTGCHGARFRRRCLARGGLAPTVRPRKIFSCV